MSLKDNKKRVFEEVDQAIQNSGRPSSSVQIIAVTKYVEPQIAKELVSAGVQHIGENRVDKFLEKYNFLKDEGVTWHLIGSLQSRKVKDVINFVDYFHALDSVKLAREIQKRAEKTIKCFLQVNISQEVTKHGFAIEEIEAALEEIAELDKVEIVGLMTMAPLSATDQELHELFAEANRLREKLANQGRQHMPFTELSMGMSGDFPIAIAHGSTFVRIGSAFFD
ncbi:YggS family pyridoxal phosphate-dependent enzyme [Streptococcus caprae]|uniref:Pyridoxal phosphate homeostasis protein n=1 Tax=Streptococcus caprae TaxID=1640501 RepID=A0ABV8CUY6_9STRE